MRLLLVEDAQDVADAIVISFARRGDAVDHAASVADARDMLAVSDYDVVILDIELPDGDGTDLLPKLRANGKRTPALILTARAEVDERIAALDDGADDYVVKPFDLREVQARVRAIARRSSENCAPILEFGDVRFDPVGPAVAVRGEALTLTRREMSLFEILLTNRGRVVSKEKIHDRMFCFNEEEVGINAIEIYIARLRRKLSASSVSIKTLRGLGYQLVDQG